jgi:two-component system sensor histidine kinase KdpD
MSFILRPSPEGYIEQIRKSQKARGVLRIYLGYAAGTGKTFAMLSAAHVLHSEGIDVVVGLVETHGRKDTESLVEGLPLLPRRTVDYRGRSLTEFDLDAALKRRPQILLVDELAHSNIGDGRHPKRWGDVLELLEAGIEVHTTLNVQHLESVAEVVTGITGVAVTEVVPDQVLEEAEEIVLIDLPPEELLERLEAGKVYRPEQALKAREGFFQRMNLLALRELAMRKAAHHVDEDARDHLRQNSLAGPWPAGERLLVCVGPSPYSERLVRATKRLADSMSATWVAVNVDTGRLSTAEHDRVDRHLQLAQRLGAEVVSQVSHSLVEAVLETAANKNVTKIVTGRTPHTTPLHALFQPSLSDAILRGARGVDVLVLAGDDESSGGTPPPPRPPRSPKPYVGALGLVLLVTAIGMPLSGLLNPTVQVLLYLSAVVGAAYLYGSRVSIFASVLSVLLFDFLFVPPFYTLYVNEPSYWLTFFGLLLNGLLVGHLTASVKEQSRSARSREADALTLLALSRDLAQADTIEAVLRVAEGHLGKTFGPAVVIFMSSGGRIESCYRDEPLAESDMAVADRAFQSGAATGKGTGTLPGSRHQWHPLRGPTRTLGVAGLLEPVALGARRREDLLETILNQVSAALERRSLSQAAQEAELLQASEKLHKALMRSVSHDLRIPLVSIQGTLTSLEQWPALVQDQRRFRMVENALSETDRLNRLVGNLLQKTRLETGHLSLSLLLCDVEDLIKTTVGFLDSRLDGRPLTIEVEPNLPLVPMDFVLIAQVLTNLLENAVAYSPPGSPLKVRASRQESCLLIEVQDRGMGLPSTDVESLFDSFVRGHAPGVGGGTGLGLSICRGLVEAHHGRISARARSDGGAVFFFTLPLEACYAS